MKLVFKKGEDHQISVFQEVGEQHQDFSYVDMIKDLIESKNMEIPDISGDFTEAEIKSIISMVKFINEKISTTDKSDEPSS